MTTNDPAYPVIRPLSEAQPARDMEVALSINEWGIEKGSVYREYLADHPGFYDHPEEEMSLLFTAFVSVAGALPISSYDLVRWIDESGVFDGGAIIEYAENNLGMACTGSAQVA